MRVFPEKISIWDGGLSQADGLSSVDGHHLIHWETWQNKKEEGWINSAYLSGDTDLLLTPLVLRLSEKAERFLRLKPIISALWLSGLQMTPLTFLSLQFADGRLRDFSASKIIWANTL